jgi:DNA repair exonuclease SbcCD ATPase subunit
LQKFNFFLHNFFRFKIIMANDEADRERLHQICALSYKGQAVWWLNAFWSTHQGEAEKLWAYVEKANDIDLEHHDQGSGLDELNAHRLLEIFDETLTVREMRTQLRSVGAIGEKERPKLVPLAHLLLARYKSDWHHFVNAPQGASEEIERAQQKLDATKRAFEASRAAAERAAEAVRDASQREQESKAAAAELEAKEAELRAAQAELDAALAEVKAQEDAYNARTEELKRKSGEGGVVSRNRAKNELAQHLAEDPLPLRRAKITAEAAAKRNERAVVAAAEAKAAAEQAAVEAGKARQRAEGAKAEADAAVDAALAALAEAEAYLKEVQATAGGGAGALWWIERELHEQRKYLPESRGGIRK